MKQYRLTEKYPSLPKDWVVGMIVGQGDSNCERASFSPCSTFYDQAKIQYEEVVNNPKFWQLVMEEFEILEFSKRGVTVKFGDKFDNNLLNGYLESEHVIQKIRRLSDDQIFSIGDKCHLSNGNGNRNPILRFEIRNENWGLNKYRNKYRVVVFLETRCNQEWGPLEFDVLVKSNEPLFVTEDGFEVFDKETVLYLVNPKSLVEVCITAKQWDKTRLIFKNISNAEKYIDENKPRYSKKQIKEAIEDELLLDDCWRLINEDRFRHNLKL